MRVYSLKQENYVTLVKERSKTTEKFSPVEIILMALTNLRKIFPAKEEGKTGMGRVHEWHSLPEDSDMATNSGVKGNPTQGRELEWETSPNKADTSKTHFRVANAANNSFEGHIWGSSKVIKGDLGSLYSTNVKSQLGDLTVTGGTDQVKQQNKSF